MYTSSRVLLLLEVGTKQNKRSSILNQRELKKTHGKHHACQPAATCYAFQTCGEHQCMQMLLPPPDVKMTRQGQFNRWPIFWYQAYLTQAQTMACLVIMKSAKKRLVDSYIADMCADCRCRGCEEDAAGDDRPSAREHSRQARAVPHLHGALPDRGREPPRCQAEQDEAEAPEGAHGWREWPARQAGVPGSEAWSTRCMSQHIHGVVPMKALPATLYLL